MTSILQPIPIDPDLWYPVRLLWANGRIREMKGSYLLDTENPESKRYVSTKVVNERKNLFMVCPESHKYAPVTKNPSL
jgi:hypothetical protein